MTAPFYVRATWTVGPRGDGDGYDVREMPRESFDSIEAARARVAKLADAGYCVVLGARLAMPPIATPADYGVESAYGARFPGIPADWPLYVVGGAR